VGAAPSQLDAPDGGLADAAGEAGAQVYTVFKLEKPSHSAGIYIIGDRGTTKPDGVLQNLAEGAPETLQLGPGEAAGAPARTDSGMKQALVGVDVAHAREKGLIEQCCLDGQTPPPEQNGKLARCDGERLGAGCSEGWAVAKVAEFEAPEAARIHKSQLPPALQHESGVRMSG